jgi:hypothetical protein
MAVPSAGPVPTGRIIALAQQLAATPQPNEETHQLQIYMRGCWLGKSPTRQLHCHCPRST